MKDLLLPVSAEKLKVERLSSTLPNYEQYRRIVIEIRKMGPKVDKLTYHVKIKKFDRV